MLGLKTHTYEPGLCDAGDGIQGFVLGKQSKARGGKGKGLGQGHEGPMAGPQSMEKGIDDLRERAPQNRKSGRRCREVPGGGERFQRGSGQL